MLKYDYINSKITGGHYGLVGRSKVFVNKMKEAALIPINQNDVVVDIGAYVGEYSLYVLRQGAKLAIAYEASPYTCKILSMNKKPNMEIYNLAVIKDDLPHINLYLSKGIGATNSIAKKKNNSIKVPAISYVKAVQPATVVKIDVEGAEYTYPIIENLKHLKAITIEWHPMTGIDWKSYAGKIMNEIVRQGFKCLYRPSFSNGWDMNCTFIRNV